MSLPQIGRGRLFLCIVIINYLKNNIMAKTINDEFMLQVVTEQAWKELAEEYAWTEVLLEKYMILHFSLQVLQQITNILRLYYLRKVRPMKN